MSTSWVTKEEFMLELLGWNICFLSLCVFALLDLLLFWCCTNYFGWWLFFCELISISSGGVLIADLSWLYTSRSEVMGFQFVDKKWELNLMNSTPLSSFSNDISLFSSICCSLFIINTVCIINQIHARLMESKKIGGAWGKFLGTPMTI